MMAIKSEAVNTKIQHRSQYTQFPTGQINTSIVSSRVSDAEHGVQKQ